MINFFKKLRKDFLQKGNTVKYLQYAVGEIVLVMIGILLALQVNSWNQERLEKKEAKNILSNLYEEFVENKRQFDNVYETYTEAMGSSIALLHLMGEDGPILETQNIDSLLYSSFPSAEFFPSSQSIDNIIQSGRLSLIKDPQLIALTYQWKALLELLNDREETQDNWINETTLPFLTKYVSFVEMDGQGRPSWYQPSKLKKDYNLLFQNLEFENIMENGIYLQDKTIERLKECGELMEKIIEITQPYAQ